MCNYYNDVYYHVLNNNDSYHRNEKTSMILDKVIKIEKAFSTGKYDKKVAFVFISLGVLGILFHVSLWIFWK